MSNPQGTSFYAIDRKLRAALERADRELGCPQYLTLRAICDDYRGPTPAQVGLLASYSRRCRKQGLEYRLPTKVIARYLPGQKMFQLTEEKQQ